MKNNIYRIIKHNYKEALDKFRELKTTNIKEKLYIDDIKYNKDTQIAIIVPYRNNKFQDRESQLNQFTDYYHNYIDNVDIYIIEQSEDGKKFNRGCLLNCGFDIANKVKKYDMYIFHDVDLISPAELKNIYTYSSEKPIHIASLWTAYKQLNYCGGITSFSADSYKKINGYPNNFYGWGGEDDAIYYRMIICKMILYRLNSKNNIKIQEMPHQYTSEIVQLVNLQKKHNIMKDMDIWKTNGLSNLKYTINNETKFKYDNIKKYNVNI